METKYIDRIETYDDATFSMSSGILTSVDGAVLLARTQNLTKIRRFCVALTIMKAVLKKFKSNSTKKKKFTHVQTITRKLTLFN